MTCCGRRQQCLLAVGLGAVVWLLTFLVASQFFYLNDDLIWQSAGRQRGSLAAYVNQPVNDHFAPLFLLVQKLVAGGSGGHYWVLSSAMATAVTLFVAACYLVCRRFTVSRPISVSLALVFGAGSVTLSTVTWWSAAIHVLGAMVFVGVVLVGALVVADRTDGRALGWYSCIFLGQFAALGFSQKSLMWVGLVPGLLVVRSVVLGADREAMIVALRHALGVGLVQGGAVLAHIGWAVTAGWTPAEREEPRVSWLSTAADSWTDGYLPGMFGSGPGQSSTIQIEPWPAGVGVALTAVIVASAVWWARRDVGRRVPVLVFLVVGVVVDRLALLLARPESTLVATPRYFADINLIVLLTVAAALACPRVSSTDARADSDRSAEATGGRRWGNTVVPLAALCYLGAVAILQPLSASEMRAGATSWRAAFSEIRDGTGEQDLLLLDLAVPWDADSYPFSRPSSWSAFAEGSTVPTTMTGLGPFLSFGPSGDLGTYRAPASQIFPDSCLTAAGTVEIPLRLDLPPIDERSAVYDVWIEVDSDVATEAVAQFSGNVEDASGRIDGWFNPAFELVQQPVPVPQGTSILHVPINPRWHGAVEELRLLPQEPMCITAAGAGPLVEVEPADA